MYIQSMFLFLVLCNCYIVVLCYMSTSNTLLYMTQGRTWISNVICHML